MIKIPINHEQRYLSGQHKVAENRISQQKLDQTMQWIINELQVRVRGLHHHIRQSEHPHNKTVQLVIPYQIIPKVMHVDLKGRIPHLHYLV